MLTTSLLLLKALPSFVTPNPPTNTKHTQNTALPNQSTKKQPASPQPDLYQLPSPHSPARTGDYSSPGGTGYSMSPTGVLGSSSRCNLSHCFCKTRQALYFYASQPQQQDVGKACVCVHQTHVHTIVCKLSVFHLCLVWLHSLLSAGSASGYPGSDKQQTAAGSQRYSGD